MTNPNESTEGQGLVYQVRLPVSTRTYSYCTDLLREHLTKIGSRWRSLPTARIVILALAHLRNDERVADLAGGNGVSPSTIGRWVDELVDLLAARAPRLGRALRQVTATGGSLVLLDGTLVRTRRRTGRQNRRNYNGKHKSHVRHEVARFERLHRKEGRASMTTSMSAV